MAYTKYSLTPADNNAAPPNGAPEGMLPSAVNDTMRDMMSQIRDVGDGIRGGTYTMTAPVITGGSITGVALSGNTLTNPVITGGSINNTPIGATTANTGAFSTLSATGVTTVQAGSVSAPAITTTGDTNTGIFFPAADTIAFTEGGVESMRINSSGQLDLVNNPIFTGGTANGILYLNGSKAATSGSALTFDGTNFSTSNSMRVTGSTASYASGTGTEITYISASTKGGILVYDRTANAYRDVFIDGATALIQTGGTERMRITSAGNVGIGTTAPAVDLEVSSATGSATPTPTEIRISTTTSASDYSTTLPWGRLSFYSADGSDAGPKIQGSVDLIADLANGGRGSMVFNTSVATTGTLTERMRIPSTGGLQVVNCVSVGNATPSTSGAGITFPATQSASSDANTLDDYEEGTWTPAKTTGTAYTSASGRYTKIGNLVTATFIVQFAVEINAAASAMSGFPFSASGAASESNGLAVGYQSAAVNVGGSLASSTMTFRQIGTSVTGGATITQMSGSLVSGTMTYTI